MSKTTAKVNIEDDTAAQRYASGTPITLAQKTPPMHEQLYKQKSDIGEARIKGDRVLDAIKADINNSKSPDESITNKAFGAVAKIVCEEDCFFV